MSVFAIAGLVLVAGVTTIAMIRNQFKAKNNYVDNTVSDHDCDLINITESGDKLRSISNASETGEVAIEKNRSYVNKYSEETRLPIYFNKTDDKKVVIQNSDCEKSSKKLNIDRKNEEELNKNENYKNNETKFDINKYKIEHAKTRSRYYNYTFENSNKSDYRNQPKHKEKDSYASLKKISEQAADNSLKKAETPNNDDF